MTPRRASVAPSRLPVSHDLFHGSESAISFFPFLSNKHWEQQGFLQVSQQRGKVAPGMSNSAHQVARIPASTRNGFQRTPGLETSWPQWMARRSRGRCQQGRRNLLARRAQGGTQQGISMSFRRVANRKSMGLTFLAIGVLQMLVSWFTAQMNERRAAAARTDTPFRCSGTGQSFEVRGAFVLSWIFGPRPVVGVVFNGLWPRRLRRMRCALPAWRGGIHN